MSHQPFFDFAQEIPLAKFVAQPSPVQVELKRRHGNYEKVLKRLQAGPATNAELVELAGHRFGGRIFELRKDGYDIQQVNLGAGLFRYTLNRVDK